MEQSFGDVSNNILQSSNQLSPLSFPTNLILSEQPIEFRQTQLSNQKQYQQQMQKYFIESMLEQAQKRQKIIKEVHNFMNAQTRFKNRYLELTYVYMVSSNWIEKWKKFVNFEKIRAQDTINWNEEFSQNESQLNCMNEDLVDKNFKVTVKHENSQFYNISLKDNIKQQKDFIYMNQQMWQIIKHYPNHQIKRKIISNNNTNKKEVQSFPLKLTLILISNRIIREIKQKNRNKLPVQRIQFSRLSSLAYLELVVIQTITAKLTQQHLINSHEEVDFSKLNAQFLLLSQDYDEERVQTRINQTLQIQDTVKENYSIRLPFRQLTSYFTFQYQTEINSPIIIYQFLEKNEDEDLRICYSSKFNSYSECPKCNNVCQLIKPCNCKLVTYCSPQCKAQDIQHIKKCPAKKKIQKQNFQQLMKNKNGVVGLQNFGNTCYMNAALQCISNIYELTDYFIQGKYVKDINKFTETKTKGALSNSYAQLLKNLWCIQNIKYFSPRQLRKNIIKLNNQYGYDKQQDTCQFTNLFLDGLHEDLNRSKDKSYKQMKQIDERSEDVISAEYWNNFITRNNSKVMQLMCGQQRSKVICQKCKYKSIKFDPFLMCLLPMPEKTLNIDVIYLDDKNSCQTKFTYVYKPKELIGNAIKNFKKQFNLPLQAKVLVYISKRILKQNDQIQFLAQNFKQKPIYFRLLSPCQSENGIKIIVHYSSVRQFRTTSQNYSQFATKIYKFSPFLTLKQLHLALYQLNKNLLDIGDYRKNNINSQNRKIALYWNVNRDDICICQNWNCHGCEVEYNNYEELAKLFRSNNTLRYVFRIPTIKQYQIINTPCSIQSDLNDCFLKYSQEEILTAENSWRCPKCQINVNIRKQINLYKAPKILIICLKRFQKFGKIYKKNYGKIKFPVTDLDLTDIIINSQLPSFKKQKQQKDEKNLSKSNQNQSKKYEWQSIDQKNQKNQSESKNSKSSSLKRIQKFSSQSHKQEQSKQQIVEPLKQKSNSKQQQPKQKILYDLFGVINHMGELNSGHYTAYSKNISKNQWFYFNDEQVIPTKDDRIVTPNAYILFYRRK